MLGEWRIFEHAELHDENGALRCPVEGCGATEPEGIELVGHEDNLMPSGGRMSLYECVSGHAWDLARWAEDSKHVRIMIHGEGA